MLLEFRIHSFRTVLSLIIFASRLINCQQSFCKLMNNHPLFKCMHFLVSNIIQNHFLKEFLFFSRVFYVEVDFPHIPSLNEHKRSEFWSNWCLKADSFTWWIFSFKYTAKLHKFCNCHGWYFLDLYCYDCFWYWIQYNFGTDLMYWIHFLCKFLFVGCSYLSRVLKWHISFAFLYLLGVKLYFWIYKKLCVDKYFNVFVYSDLDGDQFFLKHWEIVC